MHGVALGFCLAALPSQILGNCIKGDCVNGFGLFRWKDGDSYEGEWRQGVQYQGVYTAADGGKYEGDWKDDQWTGYGHAHRHMCRHVRTHAYRRVHADVANACKAID